MHSILLGITAAGMATLAQAYTPPTDATWGALLTPDLQHPVTQGETFTVTWDPSGKATDGVTVSLVLCHGPSSNCVPAEDAIVEGLPAAQKSYEWAVPSDLKPGTQLTDTGYGMLIIVDGTGEFQYSTQFSVLAGEGSSGGSGSTGTGSSKPTSTGISLGAPTTYSGDWTTASFNGTFAGTKTASGSLGPFTSTGSISVSTLVGTGATATETASSTSLVRVTNSGSTTATGTSGVPAATVSTFQGSAGRAGYSVSGAILAGAAALLMI